MKTAKIQDAQQSYFPALDGLRALAFLMVFEQHYINLPWGWSGVDIFFVLSGFLITGILYDSREHPYRMRNFYIRRTLRIFPVYYGVLLLLLITYPMFRWDWSWKWLLWPAYLGNFCRGIHPLIDQFPLQLLADFQMRSPVYPNLVLCLGHCWSLCVEEQFYLFWPCVVFWIRDRKMLMAVCLFFCVLCPLMRVVCFHTMPQYMLDQEVLYRWTPFRVDALLLGGWVALALRGPVSDRLLQTARVVGGAFLVAIAVVLMIRLRHKNQGFLHPAWQHTWGSTLVDLFAASLIVMALQPGTMVYRLFSLRPLRWLGGISYGAYVFHDILHQRYMSSVTNFVADSRGFVTAAFGLGCTIVLAWASYRWFETPFIRLKDRWTRQANSSEDLDQEPETECESA
ncbi:MAG: acyltransferase [Acidobacteriaceae bacterium]|nr:acyltransferase [Acidobacteriaceae bacterium]